MNPKNPGEYIQRFLRIKTKDNRILPLQFNAAQQKLYETVKREHERKKPVRIIILKARQLGFSTAAEGLLFHATATRENTNSLIVAHREDSSANLFRMSKLFYEELPELLKPMLKTANAQELLFENPTKNPEDKKRLPGLRSRIRCATAGGGGIGRSDTLTNVHISEYAFWGGDKADILLGILQAVPNLPETMVFIESTANGFDDFKTRWDAAVSGESDFIPLFFPWFQNPEYMLNVPPGTRWTAGEKKLLTRYNLSEKQLAWRRWCLKNNCLGDEKRFKQEYPATPDEAFISTGSPVFDTGILINRRTELTPPVAKGEFSFDYDGQGIRDFTWTERESGYIRIYEPPQPGHPYVIGGDTAGQGADNFTAQVLDNTTGRQVATLCHRFDEDLYAKQVYCLGMYYNRALVGLETNFSTYPTRELERLEYPRLYVRSSEDRYDRPSQKSHGFLTTAKTKPIIIGALVEIAREHPELLTDHETLGEMLTYTRLSGGGTGSMNGKHDDLVMALAIAYHIRDQQDTKPQTKPAAKVTWTADQYEDYYNAGDKGKEYLIEKWGNPFG